MKAYQPLLIILFALAALAGITISQNKIVIGDFSSADPGDHIPSEWEELNLDNSDQLTEYALVEDYGRTVVKAVSCSAASGLINRAEFDPVEYPILEWSWKVETILESGDVTRKSGDDYPARVYITFDYDRSNLSFGNRMRLRAASAFGYDDIPTRAINYIWANRAPIGETVENPYTSLVMMIPVQSGEERVGEWVAERQNVLEDYRDIWGEDPPHINGIAIMTDTDDTEEEALAYYGDITFHRE